MRVILFAASLGLQATCSSAFIVLPATTPTISTSGRSIFLLNVVEGAAKDCEEDLKLTLQIIKDHAERKGQFSPEPDEPQDQSETAEPTPESKGTKDEAPEEAAEPTKDTKAKVDEEPETATATEKRVDEQEPALAKVKVNREFRFVNDDEKGFTDTGGRPTISCDGRISGGVTLELTHWNGNETPDELYADTSTEMALKLARNTEYATKTKDAWVLNNHYDTDGILSVWACLEPEKALQYSDLMIAGAEAGDFGEWSSDEGVKLDIALKEILTKYNGEGLAFVVVLKDNLPGLLEDLQKTGGENHVDLWRVGFAKAQKSWESFKDNRVKLKSFNDDIVTVERTWSAPAISPYALHRKLKEVGLHRSTKRILHALTDAKGARFTYEKVGHGWVKKLVDRPSVPTVKGEQLVEGLNTEFEDCKWKKSSESLVSICESTNNPPVSIEEVAAYLAKHDDGL